MAFVHSLVAVFNCAKGRVLAEPGLRGWFNTYKIEATGVDSLRDIQVIITKHGKHRRKDYVCRTNAICIWGGHGHAYFFAGSVPSPVLDLGYPFCGLQLFSKFIYRLLPTKLVDEKVWYEN